jgi:hypothetical protein
MNQNGEKCSQLALNNPEYLSRRHREMREAIEPYIQLMQRLHERMVPKFCINIETGESFPIIDEGWRAEIDHVQKAMHDYVRANFPEFYNNESPA